MKAQDFVYQIKRLALPGIQSQGWWVADGKIAGMNAFHDKLTKASKEDLPKIFDEEVEGIKALDDYTLQFKLLKPDPQFSCSGHEFYLSRRQRGSRRLRG